MSGFSKLGGVAFSLDYWKCNFRYVIKIKSNLSLHLEVHGEGDLTHLSQKSYVNFESPWAPQCY